ncbi:restriction endonuclease subunit S [Shouchella miscanthi]|uniref:restriction endonuclease subunit S n=1 Tax=Shouchella miscanthi TaxID=2598861 RepID=UPI00119EDAD8|nr:restriction endonuclease subunit S [Shouchella miscanthi]
MYGQGKTRGQISELLIEGAINQACAALENIIDDDILSKYILYFQLFNYDISRAGSEGAAQPNLNLDKFRSIPVPLPPLKEQKRIIEEIGELLNFNAQLVK